MLYLANGSEARALALTTPEPGTPTQCPSGVRFDGVDDAPQWQVDINRDAVYAQRVSMGDLASTLATALGSSNSTDFPNNGFMQRVTIQADAARRMQPEDVMRLTVPNAQGQLVELSTMVSAKWISGPMQLTRYNGYPSMSITGQAKPGFTSGDAMKEMEKLAQELPDGFGYEWTGQSLDEKKAGSSAMLLYTFSILAVFLCLAALYESWSIPLSVLLVVPLGVFGAVAGMLSGTAAVLIWHNLVKPLGGVFAIYELLPAFIVSLLFIVVISLLTPAPSAEVLHEFDHYLDDPDDRHVDDDLVAAEIAAGEKRSQI